MKTSFLTLGIALFAFGAGTADAQITKQGDRYAFRLGLKKGMKFTLLTTSEVTMSPGQPPMKINLPVKFNVLDVKNGVAKVEIESTNPMGNGKPQKSVLNVKPNGQLDGAAGPASNAFIIPSKPLKPGEAYRTQTSMGAGGGPGGNADVTYIFRGVQKVGGKQVAVFDVRMTLSGMMSMQGSGKQYMSVADGIVVSSDLNLTVNLSKEQKEALAKQGQNMSKVGTRVTVRRS